MSTQRKAGPALYELIGRNTRVTSGKQIGGRPGSDDVVAVPPARDTPPARPADRAPDAAAPLRQARPPVAQSPRPEPVAAADADGPPPPPVLGPGRAVRVPTGYMLFGVAAVLAAALGGYMFGWVQKEREENTAQRLEAQRTSGTLTEPLGDEPIIRPQPKPTQSTNGARPGPSGSGSTTTPAAAPAIPGVIVVQKGVADPRVSGRNYAVVASLGKDRALELAEFLAGSGVEIAVLPRNTVGLYPVVSLSGFAKDEFRTKARQDHENRLRDLGKQFAKQGGGRKDFSDLWWSLYKG